MKVLFIHRSVGNNLIQDGELYELLKAHDNIQFSDFNQNTGVLCDTVGKEDTNMKMPGGDTHPENYAELFKDDHNSALKTFAMEFDQVIIKSCYPNSNIKTGEELEMIKEHYKSIASFFVNNNKQLLILTSPPLRPTSTTTENAARARQLAIWLTEQSLGKTVEVFDFYDRLTGKDNMLRKEFRRLIWLDNHPNKKASKIIAPELAELLLKGAAK